jgi:hypothetical protein
MNSRDTLQISVGSSGFVVDNSTYCHLNDFAPMKSEKSALNFVKFKNLHAGLPTPFQ